MKPVLTLVLFGTAALAAAACDDPFAIEASQPTNVDTLTVYALDNVEGSLLSGVKIVTLDLEGGYGPEVVPIVSEGGGGPLDFDVALDIDDEGRAVVYPLPLVAPGAAMRRVALLRPVHDDGTPLTFGEVTSAPRGEYAADEPVVLGEGGVVVIESPSQACSFSVNSKGSSYYAKLVVDSIRTTPVERIFVRVLSDPNCGFRSFAEGVPND